jgi:putative addiction module component (TIGR02574 family)
MLRPGESNAGIGMASTAMMQLKAEVLKLPEDERAELVHDVIASLDGPGDEGVEEAWAEEITHRIEEIRAGSVQAVAAADVMERIAARVLGAR